MPYEWEKPIRKKAAKICDQASEHLPSGPLRIIGFIVEQHQSVEAALVVDPRVEDMERADCLKDALGDLSGEYEDAVRLLWPVT